jgi:hypothetical protein
MTEQRFLPYEIWHPMLLRRLDAMMQSDPKRFNPWRIKREDPASFQRLKEKSDQMRCLVSPTEAEVLTYVAEFAALFPDMDDGQDDGQD